MSKSYWKPARSLPDLDQAQRLRFHCISMELGIVVVNDTHVERDVSSIDCLSTTEHVLVYDDQRCIATARIAFPNSDVARASGTRLGLELEDAGIDLAPLHEIAGQMAEISRLCVLRQWHGTAAAARLYEGLYVLTRQRGARYWVGGVDCKTSLLKEAELMRSLLSLRGCVSTLYQVSAISREDFDSRRRSLDTASTFYTPKQLELAEQGQSESLPIAGALAAFTKRLGATCIGQPALHPTFPRYVLPMLVDLEQLPQATLRMFDSAQLMPLLAARSAAPNQLPDAARIAS
jgi:L-ornithine Nalpha-acyltransferase